MIALPWMEGPEWTRAAATAALDRIVVAPVAAADAPGAAWRVRRAGIAPGVAAAGIGILGVRAMERLCAVCRRACDPTAILDAAGAGSAAGRERYFVADGCPECRGSGTLALEPVLEYLDLGGAPAADGDGPALNGGGAAARPGPGGWRRPTSLFRAGLRKAAAGRVDAREPIRFLLHEQS